MGRKTTLILVLTIWVLLIIMDSTGKQTLITRVQASENFELANIGKECSPETRRSVCGDSLICAATGKCAYCENDVQCSNQHPNFRCLNRFMNVTNSGSQVKVCVHKNLLPSISIWDGLATVTTFIGSILAAGGGIGGGGIFVPLLTTVGQFSASIAIPLSKAMIFGAAICNYLMFFQRKHPYSDRPLIDYDAAMILEPFTLLGTIIGVFLNVMFPDWLTVSLLCILLTLTTIRTVFKGIIVWRKETELMKYTREGDKNSALLQNYEETSQDSEDEPLSQHDEGEINEEIIVEADLSSQEINKRAADRKELKNIMEAEKRLPISKLLVIVSCWIIIFVISLFKGGHGYPSIIGIQPCGVAYWITVFSAFPIITIIGIGIGTYLVLTHKAKLRLKYNYHETDIRWNIKNSFLFPVFCVIAGIAAGLLGIGGGMIKGPILLEFGLPAEVVAATSAFMILFTSSITTVQYLIIGRLPLDYGLWFAVNGFISALIGQLMSDYLVRRFKRASIIIFIIAAVIGISTVFMTGIGIYRVVLDIIDKVHLGFRPPC